MTFTAKLGIQQMDESDFEVLKFVCLDWALLFEIKVYVSSPGRYLYLKISQMPTHKPIPASI